MVNIRSRHYTILYFTLALIFAPGCSKTEPTKQETINVEGALRDIFALEMVNGKAYSPVIGSEHPRIEFQPQESMVIGHAGCNEFRGEMRTMDDGQLKLKNITSHLSTCPQINVEKDFLQALKDINRFEREGLKLNLYRGESLLLVLRKVD